MSERGEVKSSKTGNQYIAVTFVVVSGDYKARKIWQNYAVGAVQAKFARALIKAWALAIIGAEYIFKIIPQGSHHYEKLIRPKELHQWCRDANIDVLEKKGIHYSPFTSKFRIHKSLDINYLVYAQKPE